MKMTIDREMPAFPDVVWQALTDEAVLKVCIPGCRAFVRIDDARWGAKLSLKFRSLHLDLASKVEIVMAYPPEGFSFRFKITHSVIGEIHGVAAVKLVAGADPKIPMTLLHYDIQMQPSGQMAEIKSALLEVFADALSHIFFTRLAEEVSRKKQEEKLSLPYGSAFSFLPLRPVYRKRERPLRMFGKKKADAHTLRL